MSVWHDVCLPKTSKEKPWAAGLCGVLSNMADRANNWTKWGIPSLQNRFQLFEGKPVRAHRHFWRENCGDTANNHGFCSVFLWNLLISAASESVWDLPVAMPGSRPIEAAAAVCLVLHHEMTSWGVYCELRQYFQSGQLFCFSANWWRNADDVGMITYYRYWWCSMRMLKTYWFKEFEGRKSTTEVKTMTAAAMVF